MAGTTSAWVASETPLQDVLRQAALWKAEAERLAARLASARALLERALWPAGFAADRGLTAAIRDWLEANP